MARVTVEDCIDKVDSRFELVLVASQRARTINSGAPITVDKDNDKNPVIALREIADVTVSVDELREDLVRGKQRFIETDEFDVGVPQITKSVEVAREDTIVSANIRPLRSEPMAFQDISPEEMDD